MLNIDLSRRVAVVTGATGQLGRSIATTLMRCGANVAIHYRSNPEMAKMLAGEAEKYGVKAMCVHADITDGGSIKEMAFQIKNKLGQADIIVNNAVEQYNWTTVLEQDEAAYESQWRTCVMQNVLMAKAFIPDMIKNRWGRVIAINTECAMQNFINQSAYVSGKRGMDGVLRVLAREVGMHNITVNQVAPGYTISDDDRAAPGGDRSPEHGKKVPMGRRGTDQEVANAVAFLASGLADYITGVYLPVCGGNVMPAI